MNANRQSLITFLCVLALAILCYSAACAAAIAAQGGYTQPIYDANLASFTEGGQILPDGTKTTFQGQDCIASGGWLWCRPG